MPIIIDESMIKLCRLTQADGLLSAADCGTAAVTHSSSSLLL